MKKNPCFYHPKLLGMLPWSLLKPPHAPGEGRREKVGWRSREGERRKGKQRRREEGEEAEEQ